MLLLDYSLAPHTLRKHLAIGVMTTQLVHAAKKGVSGPCDIERRSNLATYKGHS